MDMKKYKDGQICPNNIPTFCESNHNFPVGCIGCSWCVNYRGHIDNENCTLCCK